MLGRPIKGIKVNYAFGPARDQGDQVVIEQRDVNLFAFPF